MSKEGDVLKRCGGIDVVVIEHPSMTRNGQKFYYDEFHHVGDIVVPDNVFIEIEGGISKGTIGRLVDIDFGKPYRVDNVVSTSDITWIIQVDGRDKTNRCSHWQSSVLQHHDGTTKYVRNIKKHKKIDIPPHVNKFNQTLMEGVWAAGLGPCKTLYFGEVERWSKSSVWVNPTPSIPKSKANCITLPKETLVLPSGADYEQMVTMMGLSGWSGYND